METVSVRIIVLRACALGAVAAALWASSLRAQEPAAGARAEPVRGDTLVLSLAEAQRLALRQNPAFLAEGQEAEIARGELRQARIYSFNPQLELEAPGAGGGDNNEVRLFQEVEWAGQRGLRIRAAEAALRRAQYSVRDAARLILADVSHAFYAALAARRRLEVAEQILGLNEQLLEAVRIQAREGEISQLEANLMELEFGRARARVLAARREATAAELDLKRLVGITPDRPVQLAAEVPPAPDPSTLDQDSLLRAALSRRPDLAARSVAVEESRTLGRLARREAIPNLRIGALAQLGDESGELRLGPAIGLSLPIWNRNQGLVARREAEARQAAFERSAAELRIRKEVADAYRAYIAASEEERVFERDVLEPARENQRLLTTAYQAGKIDLPALLLLRNQLLDAELGYWETWLERRKALVDLESATAALDTPGAGTTRDTNDQR